MTTSCASVDVSGANALISASANSSTVAVAVMMGQGKPSIQMEGLGLPTMADLDDVTGLGR